MKCYPVFINDLKIYPFASEFDLIEQIILKNGILIAINAEKIIHSTDQIRSIINRNVGYCDGIGAVMALRRHGYRNVIKIPGCELWLKIIATCNKEKTFYLIGSKENVIGHTVEKLQVDFPDIRIVNYRNGYINTEKEKEDLLNDILEKRPDVVFVAMGSPKQELLMEEMYAVHPAIYQGLGGSFDVYAGFVKRAPKWWIDNGLEGVYRVVSQPKKIKRFLKALPFWWNVIINKY